MYTNKLISMHIEEEKKIFNSEYFKIMINPIRTVYIYSRLFKKFSLSLYPQLIL